MPRDPVARRRSSSVLAGLAVFVIVSLAGADWLGRQPTRWTAATAVAVLPAQGDRFAANDSRQALGAGQVVPTIAEELRAGWMGVRSTDGTRRPTGSDGARAATVVAVLPETSILRISTTAATPQAAEAMADSAAVAGSKHLAAISSPYRLVTVTPARGTARAEGGTLGVFLSALAALAAGLLVQQLWHRLAR
jgi:hypothetical protein